MDRLIYENMRPLSIEPVLYPDGSIHWRIGKCQTAIEAVRRPDTIIAARVTFMGTDAEYIVTIPHAEYMRAMKDKRKRSALQSIGGGLRSRAAAEFWKQYGYDGKRLGAAFVEVLRF